MSTRPCNCREHVTRKGIRGACQVLRCRTTLQKFRTYIPGVRYLTLRQIQLERSFVDALTSAEQELVVAVLDAGSTALVVDGVPNAIEPNIGSTDRRRNKRIRISYGF